MSGRGGRRRGAGRPRGSRNKLTDALMQHVARAPGETMPAKLSAVAEDPGAPIDIRCVAAKRAFDAMAARSPAFYDGRRSEDLEAFTAALQGTPGPDIASRLSTLAEDEREPLAVRLGALQRLFGVYAVRVAYKR